MGFTDMLRQSTLADYRRKIKSAPREVILSPQLLLSAMMYATAGIPLSKCNSTLQCHPSLTDARGLPQHGTKGPHLHSPLYPVSNITLE